MELINWAVDFFLNLDQHLNAFFLEYGALAYLLLFLIIFAETGLVITPFLPGDSLLFAVGALCAVSTLSLPIILIILPLAAILGDNTNYWIGHWFGPKVFKNEKAKFLNKDNLMKAHNFYEKYGGIAITLCRFLPILRTFVPFVSGVVKMNFPKFTFFNVIGGIGWVLIFTLLGYFFGNIPFVKEHFELVVVGIIVFSVVPILIEFIKSRMSKLSAK